MILLKLYRINPFSTELVYALSNFCTHNNNLKMQYLKINKREKYLQKYYSNAKEMIDNKKNDNVIHIMSELGFSRDVILKEKILSTYTPEIIKTRFIILKECGIKNISTKKIVTFINILRFQTIGQLRKAGVISHSLNVETQLASSMTAWPNSLTTWIDGDVNEYTLYSMRIKIIQRFLESQLDITENAFKNMLPRICIKLRPLKYIEEVIYLLKEEIGMPIDKINSNCYLLRASPDNLKEILWKLKSIGGVDIKEILIKHPILAMKKYSTLVEIESILKDFGINNEAQRNCFQMYTLSPSTIKERLEKAKEIPEFNILYKHPRFLWLIYKNNVALKRLTELYESKKKCVSLSYLYCNSTQYKTFVTKRSDKVKGGNDVIFFISQALGKDYSSNDISNKLQRHPFWTNIPMLEIKDVLEKLLPHFSANDIYENCQILLYPWKKISDLMNSLQLNGLSLELYVSRRERDDTSLKLTNHHIDLKSISKAQKLSLILYLLESKYNFAGDGVWPKK